MKNEHDESKKLVLGLLIGGIVGAGTLYCVQAFHYRKEPLLKKVGKTISEVGEMIENCDLSTSSSLVEGIEKTLPKGTDVISGLSEWINKGMQLWKTLKKG